MCRATDGANAVHYFYSPIIIRKGRKKIKREGGGRGQPMLRDQLSRVRPLLNQWTISRYGEKRKREKGGVRSRAFRTAGTRFQAV